MLHSGGFLREISVSLRCQRHPNSSRNDYSGPVQEFTTIFCKFDGISVCLCSNSLVALVLTHVACDNVIS